jgi:oligopeptide transport system permease protein
MTTELARAEQAAQSATIRQPRPRSLWSHVWSRLIRDPRGALGLALVLLFTLMAVIGPPLAPHNPRRLDYTREYTPPFWQERSFADLTRDPAYPLGTDGQGRDVFSRMLYGTRTSMLIGWLTVLSTLLIGVPLGLFSGYRGGRTDNLLMRLADVFYALPSIMFYILVVMVLRETPFGRFLNGLAMLVLAFSAVGWVGVARLARGATLVLRGALFVDAARVAGTPTPRLLVRHILPNILGTVLVWVTATVPRVLIVEAILGYLRIGISPPTDPDAFFTLSWGGMFLEGRAALRSAPWVLIVPAVCLALVSIGFSFLGDSLRDALDPQADR